jgi:hypothetical protein
MVVWRLITPSVVLRTMQAPNSECCAIAGQLRDLVAETVKGAALTLESVADVESGDGLAASVLTEGDSITDDGLEEDLEDTAGLDVDVGGDTLDTTTTSETTDGGLGDTLDGLALGDGLTSALDGRLAETLT